MAITGMGAFREGPVAVALDEEGVGCSAHSVKQS